MQLQLSLRGTSRATPTATPCAALTLSEDVRETDVVARLVGEG
jgi:hypothetical protein